ncbi:MAG: hypothetical protein K0R62_5674 [Nonomuraea muscovyensis]|uniref:Uncharacterized protein n=1 Tax=Nonomuraea muscovyensis TaxID=1124761 RepID=A0A7X0C5M4_9ACTN|nr:hypothetical protein [Nonomuraea muscovyensis]MDF2710022.1 hypothetical protein [Nonomuraea muscovyensis]
MSAVEDRPATAEVCARTAWTAPAAAGDAR